MSQMIYFAKMALSSDFRKGICRLGENELGKFEVPIQYPCFKQVIYSDKCTGKIQLNISSVLSTCNEILKSKRMRECL